MSAAAGRIKAATSPEHVELYAIRQGVRLAQLENLQFELETDCLSLVHKLNSNNNNLSMLGHFIDLIKELKGDHICIRHVARKFNLPAHKLACMGLSFVSTMYRQAIVPQEILPYVQQDIS